MGFMDGLENQNDLTDAREPPQGLDTVEQGGRILVLPVNGESRKITQVLSNETSLKILELLGKESMSATSIAEELKLPLTTVKYNLDSLVESGLIKVKQIKWSQKGRQIKIYESVEKLIVLVPSKSPIDRLSIISLLQKYIGVVGAAFFAAAGIEYFSAYMQAKRVIDATAPLIMGTMEIPDEPSLNHTAMEVNESSNISPKIAIDRQIPENGALNASSRALESGTGNISSGLETSPIQEVAEVPVSMSDGLDSVQGIPSIPPEGLPNAGVYGLYDTLSLHPGVWFFFGCLFIVVVLIVKEVYYKKKVR
jgi:DNA-binding transcriptional ArsR family regulator